MSKTETPQENLITVDTAVEVSKEPTKELNYTVQGVVDAFHAKLLPSWVRTPEAAIVIVGYANELGLPPLSSFKLLYLINNTPTLTVMGLGYLIRSKGHSYNVLRYFEKIVIGKDDKGNDIIDFITEIECFRKGQPGSSKISFTWLDAAKANLIGKDVWKQYPKDMLFARCLARASRIVYPDVINGFYTAEEIDTDESITVTDTSVILE